MLLIIAVRIDLLITKKKIVSLSSLKFLIEHKNPLAQLQEIVFIG